MKTRSATKAQRVEEEAAAEPSLTELLPEVLISAIGEQLAADEDVLWPRNLGSLARTCKVIKAAMKDALDKLKVPNTAARALLVKGGTTVERLVAERPTTLDWVSKGLVAADAPALTNVLKSKAVAQVGVLDLHSNMLGDEGAAAIVAAAATGGMPRLKGLHLSRNQIGDAGMQALASAFAGGAFRKLERLGLYLNNISDSGLTALAEALEKGALPALKDLYVNYVQNPRLKAACDQRRVCLM